MKTILFIDDNEDLLENTAELLALSNYRVLTASNGRDGIKLAKQAQPNLIICDVMMPDLDGYEVLHIISQDSKTDKIPFIFLSAKSEKKDFRKAMNFGADDYLTKPFDEIDLLNTIEKKLQKFDARLQQSGSDFDAEEILRDREARVYKAKEKVFYEGEIPFFVYYVLEGKVKTWKLDYNGKEFIVDIYKEKDFFSYTCIIEDSPYMSSATTLESTKLIAIPKSDFKEWMKRNGEVSAFFLKKLSDRVLLKNDALLKVAYGNLRERTAQTLLNALSKNNNPDNNIINYTREDLAHMVGTAVESLIRILKEFKDEGLIEIDGRKVLIISTKGLEKISNP